MRRSARGRGRCAPCMSAGRSACPWTSPRRNGSAPIARWRIAPAPSGAATPRGKAIPARPWPSASCAIAARSSSSCASRRLRPPPTWPNAACARSSSPARSAAAPAARRAPPVVWMWPPSSSLGTPRAVIPSKPASPSSKRPPPNSEVLRQTAGALGHLSGIKGTRHDRVGTVIHKDESNGPRETRYTRGTKLGPRETRRPRFSWPERASLP